MDKYLSTEMTVQDTEHNYSYTIASLIGTGASCAVYLAQRDGIQCLLKEYNPKFIKLERKDNGHICPIDEKSKVKFEQGIERFIKAYETQQILRNEDRIRNYTPAATSKFEANGTQYIDTVILSGETYENIQEEMLIELLRRMKAIATVIGYYHQCGFLHLDIKPSNIFILPETEKLPILIDFDSITAKKDIKSHFSCSYTKDWSAPEQTDPWQIHRVCEASDLFAIGEMLFYKLFGRHSTDFERLSCSKYEFGSLKLLENVDPRVKKNLTEIFRHTLCLTPSRRYQNADDLIEALDGTIELADPRKPFVPIIKPTCNNIFIGRDRELDEISKKLKESDRLYLSGVGGIGKSELAKQYACRHSHEYDATVFSVYSGDMISTLCGIELANFYIDESEKQEDILKRKLQALQNIKESGSKILFVVDNLDDEPDEQSSEWLNRFTSCAHKTIITTRRTFESEWAECVTVGVIDNARRLFDVYYTKPITDEESSTVDEILSKFQNHTLATELLAKQMMASRITPAAMLDRLQKGGLSHSGEERIKFGYEKANAYSLIKNIFDISNLSDDEKYILINMSLLPHTGIKAEMFHDCCKLESYDNINKLSDAGWISWDQENDTISLHPVIAEIMFEELKKDLEQCTVFFKGLLRLDYSQEPISIFDSKYILIGVCDKTYLLNCLNNTIVYVWERAALVLYGWGSITKHISRLERAIKLNNLEKKLQAHIYNTLGILYKHQDKFDEALISYKHALESSCSGDFDISVYNNILGLLYKQSLFEQFESMLATIQAKYEVMSDSNKKKASIEIFYDRYAAYLDDVGRFSEAEKYAQKSLQIRESYGVYSEDAAISYNNLGVLYMHQSDYARAEEYYRKALDIRIKCLGFDNSATLISYNNLAGVLIKLAKYHEAKSIYEKILPISVQLRGKEHSETAIILLNIGQTLSLGYGDDTTAIEYVLKAFKILKHVYSKPHKDIISVQSCLGVLYRNTNQLSMALDLLLDTENQCDQLYNNKPVAAVAQVCSAIGKTYELLKEYDKAEQYYTKALSIRKELFPPNHESINLVEQRMEELKKLKANN